MTIEQRAVVEAQLPPGSLLLVNAYAGTGKTHTAVRQIFHAAERNPRQRFLCLMFNKAIALEFRERAYSYNRDECPEMPMVTDPKKSWNDERLRVSTMDSFVMGKARGWTCSTRCGHEDAVKDAVEELVGSSHSFVHLGVWQTLEFWIHSDKPVPTLVSNHHKNTV